MHFLGRLWKLVMQILSICQQLKPFWLQGLMIANADYISHRKGNTFNEFLKHIQWSHSHKKCFVQQSIIIFSENCFWLRGQIVAWNLPLMEALIRNAKPSPLNLKWLPSNFHGHPKIVTERYKNDEYLPTLDEKSIMFTNIYQSWKWDTEMYTFTYA